MSAPWSTVEALRSDSAFLADVETTFREEDEERVERESIRWADEGSARGAVSSLIQTRRITSYSPSQDSVAVGMYLDTIRMERLKRKYAWGMGVPEVSQAAGHDVSLSRASEELEKQKEARFKRYLKEQSDVTRKNLIEYLKDFEKKERECEDASFVDQSKDRRLERKDVPVELLAQADALREIGLNKRADRRQVCGLVYELSQCDCQSPKTWKTPWVCKQRSHPPCALKIFNRAFARLVPLEDHIPDSFQSLPGWGWKILDHTFHHDGEFALPDVLQKMRQVVNRTRKRACHEECSHLYNAGYYSKRVGEKGRKKSYRRTLCSVRFEEKDGERWPMMSRAGWPLVSAPDGSVRELIAWTVVWVGKKQKQPACVRCGSPVKKKGNPVEELLNWIKTGVSVQDVRHCLKCGPVKYPNWENQVVDAGRWRLRFGIMHIPTSEFGFENNNYHFHSSFFGPILPNRPTCSKCNSFLKRRCLTCGWLVKENKTPTHGWDCANCGHVDRNDGDKLDWDCANCGHVDRNTEGAQGKLNWDGVNSEAVPNLVDGRLTQIFKEESKKLLDMESRGVWIEKTKRKPDDPHGYRAALAHALKYVAKPPASTPEGLAAYEKALIGVRRYAVCGFLQGVEIAEEKRDAPRCQDCGKMIRKIPGLGPVPFFEVEDIPLLRDESDTQSEPPREPSENFYNGPDETFAHAPRAPC